MNPDQVSQEEDGGRLGFFIFLKSVKVNTQYVWATPPPHPPLRAGAVRSCGAGTFLQLRRCHDLLSYSTLRASKMRVRRTQRHTQLTHSFL